MKNNVFNNFVARRLQSAERLLYEYSKNRQPRHLHHLRVEIKKTKAVLSFASGIYQATYYRDELKHLFRAAGSIRETGINIGLLRRLPHLPGKLIVQLQKKEKALQQQFIKNIPLYTKNVSNFRQGISLPAALPGKKTIEKYMEKEIRKAGKKIRRKNREDMHRFRMKIKKIMYVYTALPGKLQKTLGLNTACMNKLQKKAGDWHDTYSALGFLSHHHFLPSEPAFLAALKKKEKKQFRALIRLHSDCYQ